MKKLLQTLIPWLTQEQREKLDRYYQMLVDWNQRMNLTAITEAEEVATKHFLDSLLAVEKGLIPPGACCVDMGTGAGFPGVPILIVRPDIHLTLVDSLKKRLTFLEAVCEELQLSALCIHARGEDAGRDKTLRGRQDIVLSRAVASLPVLLELTVPLLKVGGTAIAYKGPAAAEEMENSRNACEKLRCKLSCITAQLPHGQRTLVLAKKTAPTPEQYPRKAGMPNQKPL